MSSPEQLTVIFIENLTVLQRLLNEFGGDFYSPP